MKCTQKFVRKARRTRQLGDVGVNGGIENVTIILNKTNPTWDLLTRLAFLNTVLNYRVPESWEISRLPKIALTEDSFNMGRFKRRLM